MVAKAPKPRLVAASVSKVDVSPISSDIVVGLVGYAGSGLDKVAQKLAVLFEESGFGAQTVKVSEIISAWHRYKPVEQGSLNRAGIAALERAQQLQNLGDLLRQKYQPNALASLSIRRIVNLRVKKASGKSTIFIVDSLKHRSEVELFRQVYDASFYLMAVHCEEKVREKNLHGPLEDTSAKFRGAPLDDVRAFMERDAKDPSVPWGQQVREVFWLGDYFVNNSWEEKRDFHLTEQVKRFRQIVLGMGWQRPTPQEEGMYLAFGAAKRSSCLSRQVGAALQSESGEIVAVGSNEVPRFGGGTYDSSDKNDSRCFKWEWDPKNRKFVGCHNDRKKRALESEIGRWLGDKLADRIAAIAHPAGQVRGDLGEKERARVSKEIRKFFESSPKELERMPGVKDLVEYSRSVHAEMNAVFSAARSGRLKGRMTLYCTTFPCHNCARHLVTAGIHEVQYIEPYIKSLAEELHSDSISLEPRPPGVMHPTHMVILPFVGVGPALFDKVFAKRTEVKGLDGTFNAPSIPEVVKGVKLLELADVEGRAVGLVPERPES